MLHVALTGNVASGKSLVARWFAEWGATVLDADALVRQLQQPGTPVFAAMVAAFGPEILAPDGSLDRGAMRRRMLDDPGARATLEAIVHPAVAAARDAHLAAARAAGARVVVSEIPLLFEAADPGAFDAIVLVEAPDPVRRARLIRDRGLAPAEADQLIASQMPSAAKRARSDFILDNAGSRAALQAAARAVWDALRARAGGA